MITAHSSLESAIEALNRGAYAYLIKPVEPVDSWRWWPAPSSVSGCKKRTAA